MSDEVTRIAKHTSLFYIQFIATLIISGISGVIIPRIIGAAEFGLVTLTHSVYGMGTGLLDLGSSLSVTRFVAKYRAEKDESSLKTAVICTSIIKYAGSAIVGIVLFFFAGYLANQVFGMPEAENLFRLIAICAFLQPIILIITNTLYGYQQISKQVLLTIFLAAVTTGLSIFLVLEGYGAIGVVVADVIAMVITVPLAVAFSKKILIDLRKIKADLSLSKIKEIIRFGLYLTVSNISAIIYMQADKVILGLFVTSAELGCYGLAFTIASMIEATSTPISSAMLPVVSELKGKNDDSSINKMFSLSSKYMAIYAVFFTALAIPLAEPIFRIVFPGFMDSILIFQILVIAAGFRAILHSFVSVVEGVGRVDITAKLRVITMVVSLILLLVLIPKFGLIGAPLAFTINAGLYLLLSTLAYAKILKLTFMYRDVAIAVMCGVVAVIVGWFMGDLIDLVILEIIVILILIPCIFVSLLWITKVITKEDLRFVKHIIPDGKFKGKN